MVKERLNLEPEVQEILRHIDNKDNFLLSGGAGSGKTYSLVQVIKQLIFENPTTIVACMTYTNSAVKEIEHRVKHQNLNVLTIHDFLWDNIKSFQKELKKSLVTLINDDEVKGIKNFEEPIKDDFFNHLEKGIQYKEFTIIKDGIISHDEVLILANYMFKNYSKLCDILKDKFKFIFIDEYQDTDKTVVEIFLEHIKLSKKENIIGFFGDSMQSIYDEGIGDLNVYKGDVIGKVKEVYKKQNRRNPKRIIDLANRLRNDGLVQEASKDKEAPNMVDGILKEGTIKFFYSQNKDLEIIKQKIGWNFNDSKQTKELHLTHNLIAPKAGFEELMEIYDRDPIIALKNYILEQIKKNKEKGLLSPEYNEEDTFDIVVDKFALKNRQKQLKKDVILENPINSDLYNQLKNLPFSVVKKIYLNKDALVDDKKQDKDDENKKGSKRDNLIKHLIKIQSNISLYKEKHYNDFIRKTEYQISSVQDKVYLKKIIEVIDSMSESTIEDVIKEADKSGICKIDDKLNKFILEKPYIYNRVKKIKYKYFQNLFQYLEGYTPFSTQHKIKGDEFDNVLVVLDNGNWNDYNFKYLFGNNGNPSVLERTQKIFYMCCTRAKENLALFYHEPILSLTIIEKAKEWFGEDNVYCV